MKSRVGDQVYEKARFPSHNSFFSFCKCSPLVVTSTFVLSCNQLLELFAPHCPSPILIIDYCYTMAPSSTTLAVPTTTLPDHLQFGNPETAKIARGSVYYLPAFHDLPPSEQKRSTHINPGIFGHPVIIFAHDPWRAEAEVLVITSLDGKSLHEYSQHQRVREAHIPIFPSEPHPNNGCITYLDTDGGLPKKSHIKIDQRHNVPEAILKPLFDEQTGQQFRLRDSSFEEIRRMTGPLSRGSPRSSRSSWSRASTSSRSSFTYSSSRKPSSAGSTASPPPSPASSWSSASWSSYSRRSPASSSASPPPSPTSSWSRAKRSSWSSESSARSSFSPSPSPKRKMPGLRYSAQQLLALCPKARICQPELLACLRTDDFDLLGR